MGAVGGGSVGAGSEREVLGAVGVVGEETEVLGDFQAVLRHFVRLF